MDKSEAIAKRQTNRVRFHNEDVDKGWSARDSRSQSIDVRWLRISYWTGAAVDLLAALQLLLPGLFAITSRLSGFRAGPDYSYAADTAAALMAGWTCVLIWADRRPIERRGVLPITIAPVILGVVMTEIWAVLSGFVTAAALAPTWVLQAALIALFGYSYQRARVHLGAKVMRAR